MQEYGTFFNYILTCNVLHIAVAENRTRLVRHCRRFPHLLFLVKGSIENANKLIIQYFPKGTDFNHVNLKNIINVQRRINAIPREKLNFLSPVEVFFKFCH